MRQVFTLISIILIYLMSPGSAEAGTLNRALQFTPEGSVNFGPMPALDGAESYSLQFWFNPDEWVKGATLLKRGESLELSLGEPGSIEIAFGEKKENVKSDAFKAGEWTQVTLICKKGDAKVLVDGDDAGEFTLPSLPAEKGSFRAGGGYTGMIDEVRVWNDALDERSELFGHFIFNTINKWHPQWESLVAYYRMDFEDTPFVAEYKILESRESGLNKDLNFIKESAFNNHGVLSPMGVSRVTADNPKLPYLINAAYTNNAKFFEAGITREQYLLSNHLLILGSDAFAEDGRIEPKTPNLHIPPEGFENTGYLEESDGRKGVVTVKGRQDSRLVLPSKVMDKDDDFTFETWLKVEGWNPGGYILRKGVPGSAGELLLMLTGSAENPGFILTQNGKEYETNYITVSEGEWFHIALTQSREKPALYINGKGTKLNEKKIAELKPSGNYDKEMQPMTDGGTVYLGENLKGCFDETLFWGCNRGEAGIAADMEAVPMPGIGKSVNRKVMSAACGYYSFDDPDDPGRSYHSQDEWLRIMKSAYEGYDGVTFHISVQGTYKIREHYGDWREILSDPLKRSRFASDLAVLSKPYDGVELDLEWIEQPEQWKLFGLLAEEIRKSLPEGKEFRISLHNNYRSFPSENIPAVDGFTFQQYGPNPRNFSYSNFLEKVAKFEENFEKGKILTSYATTTSKGSNGSPVNGIHAFIDTYEPSDADTDIYEDGNDAWSYIGPMQTYRRALHTREEGLAGIFYWDMANDTRLPNSGSEAAPAYNQAVYCSYGINANLNPDISGVTVKHYP